MRRTPASPASVVQLVPCGGRSGTLCIQYAGLDADPHDTIADPYYQGWEWAGPLNPPA